jgi:hypothetical protein
MLSGKAMVATATKDRFIAVRATKSVARFLANLIGFGAEDKGTFELRDYNGDGESVLAVDCSSGESLIIRDVNGRIVWQSSSKDNFAKSLVHLPHGTYSYIAKGA